MVQSAGSDKQQMNMRETMLSGGGKKNWLARRRPAWRLLQRQLFIFFTPYDGTFALKEHEESTEGGFSAVSVLSSGSDMSA